MVVVFVEQVRPWEVVVYNPGTWDVAGTFSDEVSALQFARESWAELGIEFVRKK